MDFPVSGIFETIAISRRSRAKTNARTETRLLAIFAAVLIGSWTSASASDYTLAIAPGLSDDQSIANLRAALVEERQHRRSYPSDKIVILLPSELRLSEPIELTAEDSGTPEAPLIIRGASRGTVFSGALSLQGKALSPADIEMLGGHFDNVRAVDISAYSREITPTISSFVSPSAAPQTLGQLNVFAGNVRVRRARWPQTGYAKVPKLVQFDNALVSIRVADADPEILRRQKNLWVAGYWSRDWRFQMNPATASDGDVLRFAKPEGGIVPATARYYLTNITSGLKSQNSYYYSPDNASVYVNANARAGETSNIEIPIARSLLIIKSAHDIQIEDVAFVKSIKDAVLIIDSDNILLRHCFVGHVVGGGLSVTGGSNVAIDNCIIDDVGQYGVSLVGGNRHDLKAANHAIRNSLITRFGQEVPTYKPGVYIAGVGNYLQNNEISFGPHSAIVLGGNDNRISGNVIHDVVQDSSDAGAVYMGRSWTARGNVIEFNHLFDIKSCTGGSPVVGIYLDDQFSGAVVDHNLIERVDLPVLVGGGRDNVITSNLVVGAKEYAFWLDRRGLTWEKKLASGPLLDELTTLPYRAPPWSERYPLLVDVLKQGPGAPENNVFSKNLVIGARMFGYDDPSTNDFIGGSENLNYAEPDGNGKKRASLQQEISRIQRETAARDRMADEVIRASLLYWRRLEACLDAGCYPK